MRLVKEKYLSFLRLLPHLLPEAAQVLDELLDRLDQTPTPWALVLQRGSVL